MQTEILVIGSGPAGSSVAYRCAKAGKKVVVIDTLFGGTCALRGCTPKKVMETITSAYWEAKALEKTGFPKLQNPISWHELAAHQSKFTSLVPAKTKNKFKERGIKTIVGKAVFVDEHTVKVGNKKVKAEQIIIATGARPRPLTISGSEYLLTNDGFFALDNLPKKVVIVGGGYIGFEMAHIMAACGAKVTILSNEEMPLKAFDAELVADLVQATLAKGIEVKLGFEADKIEKQTNGYKISCTRNDGKSFSFKSDLVLHAAGRIPNIEELNVETIGLKLNDKKGIIVNKFLQTQKHKHIYALGDVTGELPFTEIASYEAQIVSHNILNKRRKSADYKGMPMSVFTYPKLARVGETEDNLKEKGIKYTVHTESYDNSFIQRTKLNTFARYKTLVDKKSGKILGAGILGCCADEMINLLAMAIQQGMTSEQFQDLLLLYPTAGQEAKSLF